MDYNFIEIGASDFDTEIQICDENAFGLTIEPIKFYLDNLPNKKNVKKINCAISNYDGETEIYYVSSENIKKYNLPWFVRGCNTINKPHPITKGFAFGLNIPDKIINVEKVTIKSFKTLVNEYEIESIDYLKIDTEGHDTIIMNDYIDLCEKLPNLLANKILFESNILSDQNEVNKIVERLISKNYILVNSGENTILIKK